MTTWTNWARNQAAGGITVVRPRDAGEVVSTVREAAARWDRVKAAGSGHSFTGIGRPEGVQLVLDALAGIRGVDRDTGIVTAGAGTSLRQLSDLLAGEGLAMTNLGDIDVQTIAGATSTGTHGTGRTYGGLAT
ncbi:MAG: FAD-binding protein, partial [Acidimicrobiales bacterium]